jgi:hypothetical protein
MSNSRISRRQFISGGKKSKTYLDRLNPNWPTKEVAKLIRANFEKNPISHSIQKTEKTLPIIHVKNRTNSLQEIDWNLDAAKHLLNRTLSGPSYDEINTSFTSGLESTVQSLLEEQSLPEPPGIWVNEDLPNWNSLSTAERNEIIQSYYNRMNQFRRWWCERMMNESINITETMTLFWHHYFATGYSKVFYPQAMYHQQQVFRTHGLGNFKSLLRQITFGPAMIIWLDTGGSKKHAPNENFARELMELFTLGVNNYSQDDVVAASRAFTGYVTDGIQTNYDFETMEGWGYWWTDWHDFDEKTFFGQTANWTGDDILNIILEQDECAKQICRRIYKWFVYDNVDESFISEMADVLRSNDYEIKPMMEFLLLSEHFHDPNFRGAAIQNPNQMMTGTIKRLNLQNQNFPTNFFPNLQDSMGMLLFEPPDVSGWLGYHSWINSNTIPMRKIVLSSLITGESPFGNFGTYLNLQTLSQSLYNPNDDGYPSEQVVRKLAFIFFGLPLTEAMEQQLQDILLNGAEPYDWNINLPSYNSQWNRMKDMLIHMFRLPEFQLS